MSLEIIYIGYQGSPRDLFTNRRLLTVNTRTGVKTIYGIELFYLLRGKMAAFASRASPHDLHDVQHLLKTYSEEVRGFVERLDPEAVSAFLDVVAPGSLPRWRGFFGR